MNILSLLVRQVLPVLLSLLLASCASSSFLSVSPSRADGPWVNGHPTSLVRHPDSVEVRLGFIRSEPAEVVFEAQFTNYSDQLITVAPETFYYLMLPTDTAAEATLAQGIWDSRVPAIDPEVHLEQLAAKLNKAADKATSVSFFEVLTVVAHVSEEVASIKKKETTAQIAERDERHQSANAYFDEQREQHAEQADQLYNQQVNLESVMLRKITLEPGQRVTGQVYFPRKDYAKRLRFVLFFNERPVLFDFTQTLAHH